LIAVVPVRAGVLPAGAGEAMAEAGRRALVVGEDAATAAAELAGLVPPAGEPPAGETHAGETHAGEPPGTFVRAAEARGYSPAGWAAALAPLLTEHDVIILPASPDGRDLAPRLAHLLGRPLLAGALSVSPECVVLARHGGLVEERHMLDGEPVVTTLLPGLAGLAPPPSGAADRIDTIKLSPCGADVDPEVIAVLPPDPGTIDLTEAPFIIAGGAGLRDAEAFSTLAAVSASLGASMGATRVVTDAGWVPFERQIGTTGVAVSPRIYVALGISGAVQHTSGLGAPDHVLSVNLDPSCPMMAMADVAIVSDAPAALAELATLLGTKTLSAAGPKEGDGG
jgi:electron transfer flavoprotein alpha subunit